MTWQIDLQTKESFFFPHTNKFHAEPICIEFWFLKIFIAGMIYPKIKQSMKIWFKLSPFNLLGNCFLTWKIRCGKYLNEML